MKPQRIIELEKKLKIKIYSLIELKNFDIWNRPNNTYELDINNDIIHLNINSVNEIIDSLEGFEKLRFLSISSSHLKDISFLLSLNKIEKLKLQGNLIENISVLSNLIELEELDVTQNEILDFSSLINLPRLHTLRFGKNPCKNLIFLKELKRLKHLDFSYLSSYYATVKLDFIAQLTNLEAITLKFNNIEDISFLKELKGLKRLDLEHNKISDISCLSELVSIEKILLQDNSINDINALRGLTKLKILDLTTNQIIDISPLKELRNLKELNISNNLVSDITDILKIQSLKKVDLKNNKKIEIDYPKEILDAGWEAVKQYSEESKNRVPFKNVKVLLLGNPNIGKSNLLEFFETNAIPIKDESTHGVKYKQIGFSDINFHIWDFGGQEYFHATHKLFFSPNALNIVLWGKDVPRNTDEIENQFFDLDYWLRTVEQLNWNSESEEVLIVENKIDLNNPINQETVLNQKELSEKYGILNLSFASLSLLTLRRVDAFKDIFAEKAESIISKFNYPAFYDVFWKRIQEINNDFVTINEINNRPHKENVVSALKVFHNMGMLLYFHDLIPDKVFCNPQVLLDLLYEKVLSNEKKDRLTKNEIEESVLKNSLDLSVNEVIKLLKHFDLVFEIIEEKDVYFIPQYLKPINPYILDLKDNVFNGCNIRIFADNYLMSVAMLKIFSKYGNYVSKIGSEYRFWRNGIIIKKDDSVLMIEFNRKKHTIELYQDKDCKNSILQKEIVDFILDLPENNNFNKDKRYRYNHVQKRKMDYLSDFISYKKVLSEKDYPSFLSEGYRENYSWNSSFFTVYVSLDCEFFIEWKKLKMDEDLSETNFKNESGMLKKVNIKEYCHLINKEIKLEEERENKEVKSVINNFNAPVNVGIIGDNGKIEEFKVLKDDIPKEKGIGKPSLSNSEEIAVRRWKWFSYVIFILSISLTFLLIISFFNEFGFLLSKEQWVVFKDSNLLKLICTIIMLIWNAFSGKIYYDRNFDPSKENAFIDLYRKRNDKK